MNKNGFAHTGTAEEANLTALEEGLDEVDNLDTCEKDFLAGGQVLEAWGLTVDAIAFLVCGVGHTVDGLTNHVEEATVDVLAHRHRDGTSEHLYHGAALQTVGAVHSNGAHGVFANVLLAFQNNFSAIGTYHLEGVVDVGKADAVFKSHVDDCADDLGDFSFYSLFHLCSIFCLQKEGAHDPF